MLGNSEPRPHRAMMNTLARGRQLNGTDSRANRSSTLDNTELERLTIAELEALKLAIENAVRAKIRAKQQARLPPHPISTPPQFDLASEREAWLSSRRQRA